MTGPGRGRGPEAVGDAMPRDARVHVHVERLVLEGLDLPAGGGRAVADAVREEIARLLRRDGLGPEAAGGAVPSAAARAVRVTSDPFDLGTAVGRSVHGAIRDGAGMAGPAGERGGSGR